MKIQDITSFLETIAPASLQESYDNAGLLTGNPGWDCTGIVTTLDVTEAVVLEAIEKKCNLIVAHHPIIFSGLKKITGKNYVEKTIIAAIKNDIAIYAIHTNLDNVLTGVNGRMADQLGLIHRQILQPKKGVLKKLVTFVPVEQAEEVRNALFVAGAGHVGNYSECSFSVTGEGTFKGEIGTDPFVGKPGQRHTEKELKLEMIFEAWVENKLITTLKAAHPYEEVAYDIFLLDNQYEGIGSGLTGELPEAVTEQEFMQQLKKAFGLTVIKHTPLSGKKVKKIALCGGAGSFLIEAAIAASAQVYITGDVKYHEFFDANGRLVITDIGHFESEQFTIDLLFDILREKFPNFAVLKTGVKTNPVNYFV
ncbi:MAG: Nif3-like dinuclear metal center hexameric protein [Ferruginibacter sp.]|nr:Nif3-like dinuclear metal center hexameric protein [Ferruginibacter sp.]